MAQDPTQEGNLEDILQHDTYGMNQNTALSDDRMILLPRHPIPHPAPPPVRPPEPNGLQALWLCERVRLNFLNEPYCQPFGNRRLMHCFNETTPPQPHIRRGETLAWESCGRIPAQERADFFEFVACNVAFVIIALAIVFWRSRV
ncbi:hypothetical protein FA13DRAFT_1732064, partial [Coprinellus micaceus]